MATVVAYRIWSGTGAIWPTHFYVDGKLFAELSNGGFGYTYVEPGEHVVSSGPKNNPTHVSVSIIMEAGESYYVELERGMPDDYRQVQHPEAVIILERNRFKLETLPKNP